MKIFPFIFVLLLFLPMEGYAFTAQSVSSGEPQSLPMATSVPAPQADVRALEEALKKKKESLDVLKKQIEIYEKTITAKQQERMTLQEQLSSIEQRLTSTQLGVQATKQQLEILALEITRINRRLTELDNSQIQQRERLRALLLLLREESDRNVLEFFLTASTFSELYDDIAVGERLNRSLLDVLDALKTLRAEATAERDELKNRQQEQLSVQRTLLDQKAKLDGDRTVKDLLIASTQASEKKFQQFLEAARTEEEQSDADIRRLDRELREKLQSQPQTRDRLGVGAEIPMIWPVPYQGISAGFHDPTYVFRNIFEHPAIDLRTLRNGVPSNGLEVKAAANGYVGRVRDGGMGYSYVMLIHSDRVSTVYGHVSKIAVKPEQFVSQGETIALSGGLPGTPGAGRLTTGPHLHFEVRVDGIPVNPLNSLSPR